jgi:hypothetical protein
MAWPESHQAGGKPQTCQSGQPRGDSSRRLALAGTTLTLRRLRAVIELLAVAPRCTPAEYVGVTTVLRGL